MSPGLVIVLAVAAGVPLLLGLLPALRLPGALLEIVVGVLIGPSVLGWVTPDATVEAIALLGLSFLLFLAGSEVDLRRFGGTLGRRVAVSMAISLVAAGIVVAVLLVLGVGGAALIGVALLATSLGLVVPVLSDAGVLARPVGRLTSPAPPRARWRRSCCCRSGSRAATPRWPAGCCCWRCCSARWA